MHRLKIDEFSSVRESSPVGGIQFIGGKGALVRLEADGICLLGGESLFVITSKHSFRLFTAFKRYKLQVQLIVEELNHPPT